MVQSKVLAGSWGFILGGSSGMGMASAKKLAQHGMNLLIVHRDRKGSMQRIEADFDEIRAHGNRLVTLNADALSSDARQSICSWIADNIGDGKISLLLHSIALGNLKPAAPSQPIDSGSAHPGSHQNEVLMGARSEENLLNEEDFAQTVYNMGTSLLFWVQDLHKRRLFNSDARVLGLTSEGNQIAWRGYAAVSAAKCALESVSRAIAKEFAPHGIRCNILQPGITDTPALRLIPGSSDMKDNATRRNPFGRLTTPDDVANVVYLLSQPEAAWINGSLIRVDGGEAISN